MKRPLHHKKQSQSISPQQQANAFSKIISSTQHLKKSISIFLSPPAETLTRHANPHIPPPAETLTRHANQHNPPPAETLTRHASLQNSPPAETLTRHASRRKQLLRSRCGILGVRVRLRPYWRCYFPNTNAIVYVIDSVDRDRLSDAKSELSLMLEEEELVGVPLLVFANKQDLPQAMSAADVSSGLGLTEIRNRQWAIFRRQRCGGVAFWRGWTGSATS